MSPKGGAGSIPVPGTFAMFYVYVIKSLKDNTRYKGHCQNLHVRLKQHNQRKVKSTKGRLPWRLEYWETFDTHEEAIAREKYLKSGVGREWLNSIL